MEIYAYIFSWKYVTNNACELYKKIKEVCKNTKIINCDENVKLSEDFDTIQLDDRFYYGGQFETAIKNTPEDKYLWCITGDVNPSGNWERIYKRCIESCSNYNIGVFAPNVEFTNHIHRTRQFIEDLWEVQNTDCTCWIINPNIVKTLRKIPFMEISNLGWGIDIITIEEVKKQNMLTIRDYSEIVYQPNGSGYNTNHASIQEQKLRHYYRTLL
jgi:hypothetical protein